MKTIFFILIFNIIVFNQSIIIFEPGTHIEVQTGANISAGQVIINGTYSGGGTINGLPVPVELTSFTASFVDNKILISWQTSSETNNMGFEIQKLTNRKNNSTNDYDWNVLGFIQGAGTSTEIKDYTFAEINVKAGTYKYRLKQIDFDGKFTFSNEIEIVVDVPMEFALNQNYPNPFNPSTIIRYQLAEAGFVTLKVYDVLGREVITLVDEEKEAGYYKIEFSSASLGNTALSSGVYYYRIKAGNFIETKKMILLR